MLTTKHIYFYFCLSLAASGQEEVEEPVQTYSDYKVVTSVPATAEQVIALRNIQANLTSCGLDWWNDPSHPNISVSVLVPPPCQGPLTELLSLASLQFDVTVEDLETLIEEEQTYRFFARWNKARDEWSNDIYHNLEEIKERMSWLVTNHPYLGENESHLAMSGRVLLCYFSEFSGARPDSRGTKYRYSDRQRAGPSQQARHLAGLRDSLQGVGLAPRLSPRCGHAD